MIYYIENKLEVNQIKVTCPKCKRRLRLRRGETKRCKCNENLSYRRFFNKKINYIVYLLDANILIYASKKNDPRKKYCKIVSSFKSKDIKIGITDRIKKELGGLADKFVDDIIVYKSGKINPDLLDLKTNYLKQPSESDLSLIQAARLHPEIRGIITYDKDFRRISTKGVIEKRSSVKFWLGDAKEFLEKYEIKKRLVKK